ncbi:MAG: hypothetical protein LUD71_04870, partial [Clostridiales bacterium]|nr:hypothetical protein [Clostridiales bacterium]
PDGSRMKSIPLLYSKVMPEYSGCFCTAVYFGRCPCFDDILHGAVYLPPECHDMRVGCTPGIHERNLLYTGVTRAKKILVLIGEKKAVAYAVRNETTTARNTKLAERLQEMPVASNPAGGAPSGSTNNARSKNGVVYRMSEQEREQLKVAESDVLMEWIERQMGDADMNR